MLNEEDSPFSAERTMTTGNRQNIISLEEVDNANNQDRTEFLLSLYINKFVVATCELLQ